MAKFPLELDKFKKVKSDQHTTTLRHPAGHTVTLAHGSLTPKMTAQLKALPMADGGEVPENSKKAPKKSKRAEQQDLVDETKSDDLARTEMEESQGSVDPRTPMADGGNTGQATAPTQDDGNVPVVVNLNQAPQIPQELMNPGAQAQAPQLTPEQKSIIENPPAGMTSEQVAQQMTEGAQESAKAEADHANQGLEQVSNKELAEANNVPPAGMPSTVQGGPPAPAPAGPPDIMHAYGRMQKGLEQQAQAESDMSKQEVDIMDRAQRSDEAALSTFQAQAKKIHDEYQNFIDDVNNNKINPRHYVQSMDFGRKLSTGIGLILGGIAGGVNHTSNPVLDYLNREIDRDVQSQVQNKHNFITALQSQFGDLHSATQMAHLLKAGAVASEMRKAAAQTGDLAAQARLNQAAGQMEQQVAPMYQQIVTRQALNQGAGAGVDPASFVPYVVPQEHQKEVFHEIAVAQAARSNEENIMKLYDQAVQENTALGRAGRLGFNPPSIHGLEALELPMIHDQDGRVNEFEQKTLQNLHPGPGTRQSTIDANRETLRKFIRAKAQAPTAKAFGIDLDRFNSTAPMPAGPQVQHMGGKAYRKVPGGWLPVTHK